MTVECRPRKEKQDDPTMRAGITRWEPMRELASLSERMNRLFDEWRHLPGRPAGEESVLAGWAPAVDIRETRAAIEISAELPGVDVDDVQVSAESNVLTIRGERKHETKEEGETYHRVERAYGAFERSFTLPTTAEPGQIEAKFKDGVLALTVPKSEEARPKAVQISVRLDVWS
jgi:HSP20 family protein